MKKTIASVLVLLAAASLQAVEVGQVIVRQQWPWSPQVKVEYVLTGVTAPVDISVEVYDGATKLESPTLSESLSGDVYAVPADGVYALVLDPVKAFGSSRSAIADFRVKLSAAESSAEMTEDLYKIVNLESPYDVTDISRADLLNGKWGAVERDYRNIIPGSPVTDCLIWTDVTNNPVYKTTHVVFRRIKAAGKTFTMGAPTSEKGQKYDSLNFASRETPHTVSFEKDFFLAVFPTTQKQHTYCCASSAQRPSKSVLNADMNPVDSVVWANLRGWHMSKDETTGENFKGNWPADGHELSWKAGLTPVRNNTGLSLLDLPTDAMWEFACRAGTTTATYAGDLTVDSSATDAADPALEKIAWYSANSDDHTHPVGEKAPNPWGLYDMLGNVSEFCLDVYRDPMPSTREDDPTGPLPTSAYPNRVIRSGSGGFSTIAYRTRAAFRGSNAGHADERNYLGYRLAIFMD